MTEENKEFMARLREYVLAHRNDIEKCPTCDHSISDNMETISSGLVGDLRNVFNWLGQNGRHVFKISEISHLLTKSSYANFSNLREIGGLLYPPSDQEKEAHPDHGKGDGWYGMNMARVSAFFRGEFTIPRQYIKNGITGEKIAADYVHVSDFPKIVDLLSKDGIYDPDKHIKERRWKVESKAGRPTIEQYIAAQPRTLFT